MKPKESFAFFILAVILGASFLFILIVSPVLGPFLTMELRVVIAFFAFYFFINQKSTCIKGVLEAVFNYRCSKCRHTFYFDYRCRLEFECFNYFYFEFFNPIIYSPGCKGLVKENLTIKKCVGILLGSIGVIIL